MRASSALALPAIAAVAALVLAGCGGGDDAARSAEAEAADASVASAAATDPSAAVASAEVVAEAGTAAAAPEEPNNLIDRVAASNKGSRLCVSNETGGSTLTVNFLVTDTASDGSINPGQSACGEGTSFLGDDVAGEIYFPKGTNDATFSASNPWVGSPVARLLTGGPGWSTDCSVGNSSSTSGENVYSYCFTSKYQFWLWRMSDTQWKEFVIIVKDSGT